MISRRVLFSCIAFFFILGLIQALWFLYPRFVSQPKEKNSNSIDSIETKPILFNDNEPPKEKPLERPISPLNPPKKPSKPIVIEVPKEESKTEVKPIVQEVPKTEVSDENVKVHLKKKDIFDEEINYENENEEIVRPKTDSETRWGEGLLGRFLDNSKAYCQLPYGKIEFNTTIPNYKKCSTKKIGELQGRYKDVLAINPSCSPISLKECKNRQKLVKGVITHKFFSNPCPIYYFLKDKYSSNPTLYGTWYEEPVKIPDDEQFIVISCNGVTNALTRVSVQGNGKKPAEDLVDIDKSNMEEKPNIILFLLDGLSRTHFHRIMNHTKEALESIHFGETGYKLIEFFKYHANDYSSNSNMTPFMTGIDWFQHCRHKYVCKFTKQIPYERFLFHYLMKNGYKTAFPMEQCWIMYQADWYFQHRGWTNYFGFPLGEDLTDCMKDHEAPCIHGRRPYEYLFDYTRDYFKLHPNSPKFVTNLFLESHETSMKVVKVMDLDLANFLKELTNKRENTWIYVMSDHGIHYGKFYDKEWTGYLEQKLPLMTVLVPKQFQKNYPEQFKNFAINSQRLVTHYDMYKTIKDLGTLSKAQFIRPTYKPFQKDSDGYIDYGRSLFEPIPFNRDCKEANLQKYVCVCNKKLTQVPPGWRDCGSGPLEMDCD